VVLRIESRDFLMREPALGYGLTHNLVPSVGFAFKF